MYVCMYVCISYLQHRSLKNALAMKIILVGNSSVGKTSVIYRFIHGKYVKSVPTVSLLSVHVIIYKMIHTLIAS